MTSHLQQENQKRSASEMSHWLADSQYHKKDIMSSPPPIISDEEAEEIDEAIFLQPIHPTTLLGGLFMIGTIAAAVVGACIYKYPVTVKAEASVRPSGDLRIVQATAEGVVESILVKEHQVIKKGETIAIIDSSKLQTEQRQLRSKRQQTEAERVQVQAQIGKQDSQIAAETERIHRTISTLQADLERIRREYQDSQINASSQVQEAESNLISTRGELAKAQTDLKAAKANLEATAEALKAAKEKQTRYQKASEEGIIPLESLKEAELAVKQREQELEAQKQILEGKRESIEQQKQAITGAIARLDRAQAALNPSEAIVRAQEERIKEEKARGQATLATLNKEREGLIQQQINLNNQLETTRLSAQQLDRQLTQTIITAPVDGVLFKLNLKNVRQVVQPGQEIVKIVPSQTPLYIEAQVPASDIAKVQIGQTVQMRVSACPYPDYGTLKGKVIEISPDAIPSEKAQKTNNFYPAIVQPNHLILQQANKQCQVKLGMDGQADIVAREETLMRFLLRKLRLITDL
jgi:multidrug efflux pump subunit AcrA (membrane-fusion protein)